MTQEYMVSVEKKHYWNNNDDDYRHYKYEYE